MFSDYRIRKIEKCITHYTINDIFSYVKATYPYDVTTTFILVWANKHYPQSATALLENFEYNHLRSGEYIDFFFPGYKNQSNSFNSSINWIFNSLDFDKSNEKKQFYPSFDLVFSISDFVNSIEEIENMSKWRYSGNTEFLFLEYAHGKISFEHTISLNIDQLLQNNTISSIPVLMEDIIKISKSCTQVSEFANKLNYLEASKSIISSIKQYIINKLNGVHTGTFCYRNLSKNKQFFTK